MTVARESLRQALESWDTTPEHARELLRAVQRDYPETAEAELAQAYLYRMNLGGSRPTESRSVHEPMPPPTPPAIVNERARTPVTVITIVAIGLWLWSLTMPALEIRNMADSPLQGYQVLALGWLPPGTLAWSANVLFWVAAPALLRGRLALPWAGAAGLLSFTTFAIVAIPSEYGRAHVYGYSWGVLVWLTAMLVLLAAALTLPGKGSWLCVTRGELTHVSQPYGRRLMLSLLPAVALPLVFGALAVADRRVANAEEQQRLSRVIFKRGPVCSVPQAEILEPLVGFTGPLELVVEGGYELNTPYRQVRGLLGWGLPAVRFQGVDYSVAAVEDGLLIKAVPEVGPSAARLLVNSVGTSDHGSIRVRVVDGSDRLVFDQTWERRGFGVFCPEYNELTMTPGREPARTIMSAFGVRAEPRALAPAPSAPPLEGTAEPVASAGEPRSARLARRRAESGSRLPPFLSHVEQCPAGIGWVEPELGQGTLDYALGWGFAAPSGVFYAPVGGLRGIREQHALCVGESVYVYEDADHYDARYITIQKRRFADFTLDWSRRVRVAGLPRARYELTAVAEAEGSLTLDVTNEREPAAFRIDVRLD